MKNTEIMQLNEADIESMGFIKYDDENNFSPTTLTFINKDNISEIWLFPEAKANISVLIYDRVKTPNSKKGFYRHPLFNGTIKNKLELEMILKMTGVL